MNEACEPGAKRGEGQGLYTSRRSVELTNGHHGIMAYPRFRRPSEVGGRMNPKLTDRQ